MCLTALHLAAFLTLLDPERITSEPGRFVVHADTREAHWVRAAWDGSGERWCTMAPQIDRMAQLAALRSGG
jgi:hypothetical protein